MIDPLIPVKEAVFSLGESVSILTKTQASEIKKAKTLAKVAVGGLILDIILTIGTVVLANQAVINANNITNNQNKVLAQQHQLELLQTKVSSEVLCPLYEIFLKSYNPKTPNALEDPAQYEESFKVIEKGSRILQCKIVTRSKP